MMLKTTVRLDKRALEQVIHTLPADAEAALDRLARDGERYARTSMGSGPGPSRPGAFPNVQSGQLRASLYVYTPAALQRRIASDAEYAPALEFGTRRMSPRPFLGPTLVYLRTIAVGVFKEAISGQLKQNQSAFLAERRPPEQ